MEYSPMTSIQWLTEILNNPKITDICINGSKQIYIDQGKGLEKYEFTSEFIPDDDMLRNWVLAELSRVGKTWDAKYPFVDATLHSGHRIHVAFPPISRHGLLISLRRLPQLSNSTLQVHPSGSKNRWNHSPLYDFLALAISRGESILISGATGSGKTTLANDLLEEVGPQERIIALEDTPELAPQHPHFVSLVSRPPNADGFGEVTLRTLLKQTLRMRPERIILGECRGQEVLELLQALNTGHRGALATIHANSPRDALRRIELLCLLNTGGSLPIPAIRELISLGLQFIVQVKRIENVRKIVECWKIEGREGDTILLRQVLESNQ